MTATFDKNDHTLTPGWATYHRHLGWRGIFCLFGHSFPAAPIVQNGYSPSNTGRCRRCRSFVQWYVAGQHRYGGLWR